MTAITKSLLDLWPLSLLNPNPAKRIERQRAHERRALERKHAKFRKLLKQEAQYYEKMIESTLSRLKFYHYSERRQSVETVQLRAIVSTPEAHYARVETTRLPTGTKISDLKDVETLENLAASCEREVYAHYEGSRGGMWYIVEREGGVQGIPSRFSYEAAFSAINDRDPPLMFTVGVGVNSKILKTDLAKAPHLLIGGSTGQGKSVCMNNIIVTIARRTPPEKVRFYMIDLKGGIELAAYARLPHLARDIVTEPRDALVVLDELLEFVDQRLKIMKGKARNIQSWNKGRRNRYMPYIVLVIDELAMLMLNTERIGRRTVSTIAAEKLARLAAISRAVGIHCVVATQQPSTKVIKGIIKANFPARIAFACAQNSQSVTIIDNSRAAKLTLQGRMVFHKGNSYNQLQGPFISEDMAFDAAADLERGDEVHINEVTKAELVRYATERFEQREFDGEERWPLPVSRLFEVFKDRISIRSLEMLLDEMIQDRYIECDGLLYEIFAGTGPDGGNIPRTCAIVQRSTFDADSDDSIPDEQDISENLEVTTS